MASSDVGFNPGWGMRLRILVTSVLIFGVIAALIGLLLQFTGIAGSGSIFFWLLVSFVMLGVQWYFGPAIIKFSTGAKQLSREQSPELFAIVQKIASKARLPMPKLYIVQNASPNAFAFGRTQSDSNIAVHSGILNVLTPEESPFLERPDFTCILRFLIQILQHRIHCLRELLPRYPSILIFVKVQHEHVHFLVQRRHAVGGF